MDQVKKSRRTDRGGTFARTDLACESWDGSAGVVCREEKFEAGDVAVSVAKMEIVTRAAEQRLGRRRGKYVTFASAHCFAELDDASIGRLADALGRELRDLCESACGRSADSGFGVLVAGLGNADMTADAVGPMAAGMISATRHLRDFDGGLYRALGCSAVSVVTPGVLGKTGIESAELLRSAVRAAHPDVVIAIDALAARSCERLGRTIQLSDSGIIPGSGVGNERKALTRSTLGVPVISVGVPTVVDSSTLVWEALQKANVGKNGEPAELSESLRRVLESGKSFFVSPREADIITRQTARVIASAIDGAFGIG